MEKSIAEMSKYQDRMNFVDRGVVFIPAFKKSSRFQDDLVTKLNGVSLIERAIDKAKNLGMPSEQIHVLTDSQEVRLTAERLAVGVFENPSLDWISTALTSDIRHYINIAENGRSISLILSPYSPLLKEETILLAFQKFSECAELVFKAVKIETRQLFDGHNQNVERLVFGGNREHYRIESTAFTLLKSGLLAGELKLQTPVLSWVVGDDAIEIRSLQDWWVCEKLLQRCRLVFRVIGNDKVGMGHIYRSLSLAHEMKDHEVLFVTDTGSDIAVRKLADYEYWTGVYDNDQVLEAILALEPDLVVFDSLDTEAKEILRLKAHQIPVASFEDLGSGSKHTDLTINELYDVEVFSGKNYLWGHKYFFVREEFLHAIPCKFEDKVTSLILVFGGTDQHDLSKNIYRAIRDICSTRSVSIHIVTGPGYMGFKQLSKEVKNVKGVTLTHATGVISNIMEQCSLAITSNGRTVYELAHMNIPALVIAQHNRENTHNFAREDNGFQYLGVYNSGETEKSVRQQLVKLLDDSQSRQRLYEKTKQYSFFSAKAKIVDKLIDLASRNRPE